MRGGRRRALAVGLVLFISLFTGAIIPIIPRAEAAGVWPDLTLTQVVGGFSQPVHITHAGDGSNRLFVVERAGKIRIFKNGVVLSTDFLDITTKVLSTSGEQGLLSVAFPPDFGSPTTRHFYVNYTRSMPGDTVTGETVVARYSLKAGMDDEADPNSEQVLLVIDQPATNHNGGLMMFGPDGYLYIGSGDGGGQVNPNNPAQRLDNQPNNGKLLGKILRINVEPALNPYTIPPPNPNFPIFGQSEVWALGKRNPWKFSFDRQTGDLYIADVGEISREEVNFQPAGSTGGQNYGWIVWEGTRCTGVIPGSCNNPPMTYTFPVAQYDHSHGDCSITGGFVYRGTANPRMQGIYFYGDLCSGRIRGLKKDGATWQGALLLDTSLTITTFGEDESGGLFVADYDTGIIYLISDAPSTSPKPWWFTWYDDAGMQTNVVMANPSGAVSETCDVFIGKSGGGLAFRGSYPIAANDFAMHQTAGLIDGPAKVQCNQPVVASEEAFFGNSYNELLGVPESRFNAEWWFPWYDNQGMHTWVMIGNPSSSQTANCTVTIAGTVRGSPSIAPNAIAAGFYGGIIGGPVKVLCDIPVYSTERAVYANSFNEVVGTPFPAMSMTQWFPWYDNQGMTSWVIIGNPNNSQTVCNLFIGIVGGNLALRGTYTIAPGNVAIPMFAGLIDGPVKVDCDLPVFASERSIYQASFNEVAGTPPSAFDRTQWFPTYDNAGMIMWVLIGNPSSAVTANCAVYIGGVLRSVHAIAPNGRDIPQYPGPKDGPVRVQCDNPVYASERTIFQGSFNEMMAALPY